MIEFTELLTFVECRLKNNIKENDYIVLLQLIQKIYLLKEEQDSDEEYNDVYGSY